MKYLFVQLFMLNIYIFKIFIYLKFWCCGFEDHEHNFIKMLLYLYVIDQSHCFK